MLRKTLTAVALLVLAAAPATALDFTRLAPHRAVYDLKLDKATERSGIKEMNGRIVYEITGNACEGLTIRYRMVSNVVTGSDAYQSDQQTSTYESPDRRTLDFVTRTFVNERPEKTLKGKAERGTGGLTVALETPEAKTIDLPDAVFVSAQMLDLIAAAERGERLVRQTVFDGSDPAEEVIETSSVIGPPRRLEAPLSGEDAGAAASLSGQTAWPVNVSYFNSAASPSAESVPIYEAGFLLYPDGVSRRLSLRYGEYSMIGQLVSLERLPASPCERKS